MAYVEGSGEAEVSGLDTLKGQTIVVKLGGEVMLNAGGLAALATDIARLVSGGIGVVLVHGGGPQADTLSERLGYPVRKVAGRRVTDDGALEVAKMVYAGSTNVELLAALKKAGARGVGLSGVDADLITAVRRPPRLMEDPHTGSQEWVDFGHVGDIAAVDSSLLRVLLATGYVPVVASLAAGTDGQIYNINADTIAQALAVALGARRLVLVTNVPGILRNPSDRSTLVSICTPDDINRMIGSGAISGGMLPKVQNCLESLRAGVESVQILECTPDKSLLISSLLRPGVGTLVTEKPV